MLCSLGVPGPTGLCQLGHGVRTHQAWAMQLLTIRSRDMPLPAEEIWAKTRKDMMTTIESRWPESWFPER